MNRGKAVGRKEVGDAGVVVDAAMNLRRRKQRAEPGDLRFFEGPIVVDRHAESVPRTLLQRKKTKRGLMPESPSRQEDNFRRRQQWAHRGRQPPGCFQHLAFTAVIAPLVNGSTRPTRLGDQ